jgi:FkbH-like protein
MRDTTLALPWLTEPPPDFSARCRALAACDADLGERIQALATHRLDAAQSVHLARALARLRTQGADLAPLSPFRLGTLSSATFDLVTDCIPAAAARHGVAVEIVPAPYDQVMQQALDPGSEINRGRPDGVLVAVDHRWLGLEDARLADVGAAVGEALERLGSVVEALRHHTGASAIVQTLAQPPLALFGSLDRRVAGSVRAMIDEANRGIVALAERNGSYLLDTAWIAERVGTERWFDPSHWAAYKLPFVAEAAPLYAEMLGRLLGAIRGRARKCLVLDLDNTIWGGAIGDDGLDGIVLGRGSAAGEAFLSVQRYALALRERGVILAVCSKNDEATARSALREHPEMLLREDHIAALRANWSGKPANLMAIADALNIGLDALVVLDDNPAERAAIRAALPTVAVPELPGDPSHYADRLAAAGYFESVGFSDEDAGRAGAYAADTRRAVVRESAHDVDAYLASLGMAIRFAPFDARGRPRIVQLVNKTNQFNLTTRRYTDAEIAGLASDPAAFTLQVRLEDRFGDLGMIGAVVCRAEEGAAWEIDTWLMSCRVLGRRVEEAVLARLVEEARRGGVKRLLGRFVPTAKNAVVREHYDRLGFVLLGEDGAGGRFYALEIGAYKRPDLPFTTEG